MDNKLLVLGENVSHALPTHLVIIVICKYFVQGAGMVLFFFFFVEYKWDRLLCHYTNCSKSVCVWKIGTREREYAEQVQR